MNRNPCSSGKRPEGAAPIATTSGRTARSPQWSAPCAVGRAAGSRRAGRTTTLRRVALCLAVLCVTALGAPLPATAQAATGPPDCPEGRELCVQAERSGGIDLKTGVAHLVGNVRGIVRSRALEFSGRSLTAFRNGGGQEWVRLVLEDEVELRQQDRASRSDHGVLERNEIRLTGNVEIEQGDLHIKGHEATIRSDPARTTIHGLPGTPLTVRLARPLLRSDSAGAAGGEAPPGIGSPAATGGRQATGQAAPGPGATTTLHALKAVVEEQPRRVVLTGNVHIEQSDNQLSIDAQQVALFFTAASELESFRAEGGVVIAQPERRISADFAQSRNALRTILLVGHASMQQKGQFDLKSDRMEVFVDANKGIMQSQDRQQPITLSLQLGGEKTYGLTRQNLLTLSDRGMPPDTLEKLSPLVGQRYETPTALREAVAGRLTPRERQRHLETILTTAR